MSLINLRSCLILVNSTKNSGLIYSIQKRCMASVIRVPVPLQQKMEREKKRKWREGRKQDSRKGDEKTCVISCKRSELNHYLGQTYNKFDEIKLASKGWKHIKAAGDYFTINGCTSNPSLNKNTQDNEDTNFESLGLNTEILSSIKNDLKFDTPTNIQTSSIPHVLEGKNTLITAETGNGKTISFLAPMLQQITDIIKSPNHQLPLNSPLALIITPGRELAQQIHGVASEMCQSLGINVDLLIGGKMNTKMRYANMSQTHLLVATIGALSKMTTVGIYRTNFLRHIALDEADTLLDDSFTQKVIYYLSKLPIQGESDDQESSPASVVPVKMSGIQLTLVAATLPRGLDRILEPVVNIESLVNISTPHLNRLMSHVPQRFIRVNQHTKEQKLIELVKNDVRRKIPVVIFSNKSKTADWISLKLNELGIPCTNFHANMCIKLRAGRFEGFQNGQVLVLSCTDLTSRGLDTVQAGHVINFDFPSYMADYIHRCGRTGRVGSYIHGHVTNFVHHKSDVDLVHKIEYAVRKGEAFHNVNANIKRIITTRNIKKENSVM